MTGEGAIVRVASIRNQRGLHARAAAKFVKLASAFNAQVRVIKGDMDVSGTSIMGLMMLGAAMGDSITIRVKGPHAEEALEKLAALVENRFGEE